MAHKVPHGFGPWVRANGVVLSWTWGSGSLLECGMGMYMEEDDGDLPDYVSHM